jgi:hypothetical protein
LTLLIAAKSKQGGTRLSFRHPMRRDWRARREQFFQDHKPLQPATFAAAILLWPCHAQPIALTEFLTEIRIKPFEPCVAVRREGVQ